MQDDKDKKDEKDMEVDKDKKDEKDEEDMEVDKDKRDYMDEEDMGVAEAQRGAMYLVILSAAQARYPYKTGRARFSSDLEAVTSTAFNSPLLLPFHCPAQLAPVAAWDG